MSFNEILKMYKTKTCILSIEKTDDLHYGNIRVVAGNQAHCDDILQITGQPFVPGCPYEHCFPKNMNFEDYCYRCAIGGEPMHSYVNLYQMGLWLNMFMIPLESDEKDKGYCIYSYEVTPEASYEKMSDISAEAGKKVLETCIKLRGSSDFDKTMSEVITDIRDICTADEVCLLLLDYDERKCHIAGEAFIDDHIGSVGMFIDDVFCEMAFNWENTLQGSTCIIIKDEKDFEEIKRRDPVWYESLTRALVQRLVFFPLKRDEQILGYIWAINFNLDKTIMIKETLELTSFFLGSELYSHMLVEKLRKLSSIDLLTGIMNRNIMNNRIDRVIAGKDSLQAPYAIIFTDLNGLKRVNDTSGHQAGDTMLKDAAKMLSEVFYDAEVYRVGGDEFMVIACKMAPDTVKARVDELVKMANASDNVRFAVGISLSKDEPDILKAMRLADQRMYEDKKRYYQAHPDLIFR